MTICPGCGAEMQDKDPKKIGYTPKIKENGLCMRCFKMQHYHTHTDSYIKPDDFLTTLDRIGNQDALVVYLVDAFDLQASFIPGLMRHIGYNDVYVLINKRDILPKSLKDNRIIQYVRRQLKQEGINVLDATITSGKKILNFDEIYDKIQEYRNNRDVYIVGMANVGKSTFIKSLLKHYANYENAITISEFPGTTLDFIKIAFDEKTSIIDTPGVINDQSFTFMIDKNELCKVIPQKEIKPKTFQVKENQSYYIGEYLRLDCFQEANVTFYISQALDVHRTKLENADNLFNKHHVLTPKFTNEPISSYQVYTFQIDNKKEIYISGLGFISMKGEGKIKVYVPKTINLIYREGMISC